MYPEIRETSIFSDPLFRQHQEALDDSQLIRAQINGSFPDEEKDRVRKEAFISQLFFFTYTPHENDSIYTVAADFMITVDTLASLNGIERSAYFEKFETLIVPTIPGLYVRREIKNELERRLDLNHKSETLSFPVIVRSNDMRSTFDFYPNGSFTAHERLYFISLPFRSPLDHDWEITSSHGNRVHPVTGAWEYHNGIDVRAPVGTPVFAVEDGEIIEVTELDNYGIIIILKHRGGYQTRYAHLNNVAVKKGDAVKRGQMIAKSGNTGISTGPHLHFEIRLNGVAMDPVRLVSQGSQ